MSRGDVIMIQEAILNAILIGKQKPIEIVETLPIGRSTLFRHLRSLEAQGKIYRINGKVFIHDSK